MYERSVSRCGGICIIHKAFRKINKETGCEVLQQNEMRIAVFIQCIVL